MDKGDNRIESIVIVGGGTSGWTTAAYLNRVLNGGTEPKVRITLVESEDIGIIGVGEATIPTLRDTLRYIGIEERDFMLRCNASFKLGIKFANWMKPRSEDPEEAYWHPFETVPVANKIGFADLWRKRRLKGDNEPFAYAVSVMPRACDALISPKLTTSGSYQAPLNYAYQMDAILLAGYLKELMIERGVQHVVDNVVDVVVNKKGFIGKLKLEKSGDLTADLYIDCSGFRSILLGKALDEPFISYKDGLLCDRAVAIPAPHEDDMKVMKPFTTATGLNSGWTWDIPLFSRQGRGYVYSSDFISDDDAEQELRDFIGPMAEGVDARLIKMRVGRTRNFWVKNCLAIGLSGGFIEPLESTGIYFVEVGLSTLVQYFPDKSFNQRKIDMYNQLMAGVYDQTRDFIVLHYCLTPREDTPFWKANKHDLAQSDQLKDRLDLWQYKMPSHLEVVGGILLFGYTTYIYIMAGMDRLPAHGLGNLEYVDDRVVDGALKTVRRRQEGILRRHPDHLRYLRALRTSPMPAATRGQQQPEAMIPSDTWNMPMAPELPAR